jgi:hypothetical protein
MPGRLSALGSGLPEIFRQARPAPARARKGRRTRCCRWGQQALLQSSAFYTARRHVQHSKTFIQETARWSEFCAKALVAGNARETENASELRPQGLRTWPGQRQRAAGKALTLCCRWCQQALLQSSAFYTARRHAQHSKTFTQETARWSEFCATALVAENARQTENASELRARDLRTWPGQRQRAAGKALTLCCRWCQQAGCSCQCGLMGSGA